MHRCSPIRIWLCPLLMVMSAATAQAEPAGGQAGSPPPAILTTLLARAATYVERYTAEFSNVVAEERYLQQASGRETISRGTGVAGTVSSSGRQRRELVSDFLLVKVGSENSWVPFRDVFQVDGRPVREREERLAALVLRPSAVALEQTRAIIEESARYNIGEVQRTINMPLLALVFLEASQQSRFSFSLGKEDTEAGVNVFVVNFQEQATPAFVKSPDGRDLFASGRFWIAINEGRVLKSEMVFQDSALRATITTSFRPDDRFELDVPFEMEEEYSLRNRSRVTGRASYGRFRRFDVTATESAAAVTGGSVVEFSTGMVLLEVGAGSFAMGSLESEPGRGVDETMHDVSVGAFYLGRFEVTEQEWRDVMGELPDGATPCGPRCPVTQVTFDEATEFLEKLNARAPDGLRFRLPTEAEWEYACRAGTASPFSAGDSLTATQANLTGTALSPVGAFEANPWGLFDMHGNAAEWTADRYAPFGDGAETDPTGPSSGRTRVIRGGSWEDQADGARCAARAHAAPDARQRGIGFRVGADLVAP